MKLKKGDKVRVMAGKDQGKEAKIERIFPKDNRVVLPGINMSKRHLKSKGEGKPGGIIDVNRPIPVDKVSFICLKCSEPTRIGFKFINDKKVRICRKCVQEID